DPDVPVLDSTAVRAHPRAAGSKKSGTGPAAGTIRRRARAGAGSAPRSTGASTASATPSSCSRPPPGSRTPARRGAAGRPPAGGRDRGQGVRQEGAGGGDRIARRAGSHPDAEEPRRAARGRSAPVRRAERVRAVPVEGEAVPAGGRPGREESGQPPGGRGGGRGDGDAGVNRTTQGAPPVALRPRPPTV